MFRLEEIGARALKLVGDDRFKLSLLVSKRANQLANGQEPLISVEDYFDNVVTAKPADIALVEVAEGKVTLTSISQK